MTLYYVDFGDVYGPIGEGTTPIGNAEADPTDLDSVRALWSALPADLRLALAKTAPKVAGKWWQNPHTLQWWRSCPVCDDEALCFAEDSTETMKARANVMGADIQVPRMGCLAEAQVACDAELIRQGYVLEGET